MASPQKENGYISIANELWIALIHVELREYERKYLMALLAKTYGFNKKEDWVSNSQFCEMTGVRAQHIARTEKDLCDRKIIIKTGVKKSINKNYEQWLGKDKVTSLGNSINEKVTSLGYKVTSLGKKSYLIRGTQKTKDNIQKTKNEQSSSLLLKNKKMRNSFKYQESNTSDTFEDVVDYDTGAPKEPPKKNTPRNKQALAIQDRFIKECENQTGKKPIKDIKGYFVVLSALKHLQEDEIEIFMSSWFSSGEPIENLVQITRCFSHNRINKWRATN